MLIAAAEGIDRGLQAGRPDREPDRDPPSLRTLAATMDEPREGIGDEPIQVGKRDILANAGARQQALGVPVFRHEGEARVFGVTRSSQGRGSAVHFQEPAPNGIAGEQQVQRFFGAASGQAGEPEDFPRAQFEGKAFDPTAGKVFCDQDRRARRGLRSGGVLDPGLACADNRLDDRPTRQVRSRPGAGPLSIAQDSDPVRDLEHFRQPVAHVEKRMALGRKPAHVPEQNRHFRGQ